MPFDAQKLMAALPQILGAAGGLTGGSNAFSRRWQQLEEMDRQRKAQEQQQQIQQGQFGIQQQDAALRQQESVLRQHADARQQQDQLIQAANSIRQLADPTGIEDPAVYEQRKAFALNMAPQLGVDPGFVTSLFNIQPSQFEVTEAKKKLAEIEKTYSPQQMAMLEADDQSGSAPLFMLKSGKKMTVAQLRQLAGTQPVDATGKALSMRVPAKPDVPNTPEEQQIADALGAAEERAGRPLTRAEKSTLRMQVRQQWMAAGRAPAQDNSDYRDLRNELLRTQIDAANDKLTQANAATTRARDAARKTSGDTLDLLRQLIDVRPDGQVSLKPATANLFGMRMPGGRYILGSETANAASSLDRLKGRVVLDLLGEMKSQSRTGATGFGQLSIRELELLENAATRLNSSFISDASAADELKRIYDVALRAYEGASSAPVATGKAPAAAAGGTVKMRAPNGQVQDVPASQVEHYRSLGAQVVR